MEFCPFTGTSILTKKKCKLWRNIWFSLSRFMEQIDQNQRISIAFSYQAGWFNFSSDIRSRFKICTHLICSFAGGGRHLIEILQRHIYSSTWGVRPGSCFGPDIDCNRCQLKPRFGSEWNTLLAVYTGPQWYSAYKQTLDQHTTNFAHLYGSKKSPKMQS